MHLTVDHLRKQGDALHAAEERERFLAWSGLKSSPELQRVYREHRTVTGDDGLTFARRYHEEQRATPCEPAARKLLAWQVEALCARRTAELMEREQEWGATALLAGPDGNPFPLRDFHARLARTERRDDREALYAARSDAIERGLGPIREQQFADLRNAVTQLDLAEDWLATWQLLSGIDIGRLCQQATTFLEDSQPLYRDLWSAQMALRPDIDPATASWIDVEDMVRGASFDPGFPADAMIARIEATLRAMGLDLFGNGRVSLDDVARPTKNPVAMCFSIRVPDEVVIVTKPNGGHWDWSVMLHEVGHALHYSRTSAALPFEDRRLGDESVAEACAFLFQSLISDEAWLREFSDLDDRSRSEYLHFARFVQLFFVRRYCAAMLYEVAVLRGQMGWGELPALYAALMTEATGFRYRRGGGYSDIDFKVLYRARYLRGWQLQSQLSQALRERFGTSWWHSAPAAHWLDADVWSHGMQYDAEEVAMRLTGQPLSFDAIAEQLRR